VALHLDVPVGSSPDLGRKRPYTIGGPADVATAQSLYPSITPPMRQPGREIMGLADRLGHVCPLSITSESSQAACLQC
jgi:hypothetical protein